MRFLIIFSALFITSLTACETTVPVAPVVSEAPEAKITGSDRDVHGCISSAGYAWCARTKQCERPWELAKKQSFAKTQEAFDKYCDNPAQ